MKVCPVCSEEFSDELRFCDVDGSKLARRPGAGGGSQTDRLYPLLGVLLLLGALILSATSIFMPKPRIASSSGAPAPRETAAVPVDSQSAALEASAADGSTAPASTVGAQSAEEVALADARKREKPASAGQDSAPPAPNPKAAFAEETEGTKPPPAETKPSAPPTQPVESESRAAKPEPRPSDVKASATSPSEATTAKTQPTTTKPAARDSDAKKKSEAKSEGNSEEKNKEKKGGFLRVFKKIFGKD
jgi:hypothetical protein